MQILILQFIQILLFNSNEVLIQSELDEITKVILINQLGQKIRTISEKVHENLILLKTQDLQKGIYFVTIETNHKIFTKNY
ncbi:MAG: T9SS type A sorting domain-containing protein [Saprospiraceae bacterium]|nr:T9SS type A sorting domain-containing protein [Saprospiraceae bacterium]